jgi:hypothetical protein
VENVQAPFYNILEEKDIPDGAPLPDFAAEFDK